MKKMNHRDTEDTVEEGKRMVESRQVLILVVAPFSVSLW
jgi:hypothetical protein